MKKLSCKKQQLKSLTLLITLSLMVSFKTKAQVTLDTVYLSPLGEGNNFFVTNLGDNNYKYVMWDYYNCSFSLYDLNNSPYLLNIPIPLIVCDSGSFYGLGYITTTLFDCDSTNIEYAMIGSGADPTKKFWIYRTDGTLIFSKDSATTNWCVGCLGGSKVINGIENTPAGAKLFLFTIVAGQTVNYVYNLCGTLPEEIKEIGHSGMFVKEYPNPSDKQFIFDVTLPNNYEDFELTIFDSSVHPVKSVSVTGTHTRVNIDPESMSSGNYFYSLHNKNKIFQTGKIILTK
ncbi:MAG: T9SS type A sorting domain-containing protein [Bacteroidota bacterium]